MLSSNLNFAQCAKLRSWVGPDTFFEGQLPSARNYHGFAASDDGRFYIFGGLDETGRITWSRDNATESQFADDQLCKRA